MLTIEYTLNEPVFKAADCGTLKTAVQKFWASQKIAVIIEEARDSIRVSIPDSPDIDADEDARIVVGFCTSGRFGKAKKVARELIARAPWRSESHRLLAQALMEQGEADAAAAEALLAAQMDPRNSYALTLLGNIKARNSNDGEEGLAYYRRAYELRPTDAMIVGNYAGILMKLGQEPALREKLFRQAIELAPDYLNAYYGLACALKDAGRGAEAFDAVQKGLKLGKDRPENKAPIRLAMMTLMTVLAREEAKRPLDALIEAERAEVEKACGVKVVVEHDESEGRLARMEMAERYHRDYHRLVVGADAKIPGAAYCVLHELEKLLMRTETHAAVGEVNLEALPASRTIFREKTLPYVSDRIRDLLASDELDQFLTELLDGINGQLMNCPLDYFVFRRLYDKFPAARPHQLVAVSVMASEAVRGAQEAAPQGLPRNVVRINRTLSAVSFLQYRDLLGFDRLAKLAPEPGEMKLAKELYEACREADGHFRPGDEWVLVSRFIQALGCSSYCSVVGLANDPVAQDNEETSRVLQAHIMSGRSPALNAAVTMHMAAAIKRLRKMPPDEVRKVAFEIATLGCSGISPDKRSGYSVPSLGGEDMSGPQMFAYYYVSWKLAFPEKIASIGLPFGKEYEDALRLVGRGD